MPALAQQIDHGGEPTRPQTVPRSRPLLLRIWLSTSASRSAIQALHAVPPTANTPPSSKINLHQEFDSLIYLTPAYLIPRTFWLNLGLALVFITQPLLRLRVYLQFRFTQEVVKVSETFSTEARKRSRCSVPTDCRLSGSGFPSRLEDSLAEM